MREMLTSDAWMSAAVLCVPIAGILLAMSAVLIPWEISAVRAGWKPRHRWLGKGLLAFMLGAVGAEKMLHGVNTFHAMGWPSMVHAFAPIEAASGAAFVAWLLIEFAGHLARD